MRNSYVSIISSNYFPQALTLIESFKKIYPQEVFTLLVLDIEPIKEDFLPQTRVLTPECLGIDSEVLKGMRKYYDVVELATSLKPFVLKFLIEEGFDTATYLDPDIQLFGEIEDRIELDRHSAIRLTPHRYSPSPPSNNSFNDLDFLKYGIFNLGYICVNRDSIGFLNWWSDAVIFNCTRYPGDSVFTDQKWVDLVPTYFNYSLVKNFGFNVAPWNLDERKLSFHGTKILVNNEKELAFFHFSQISNLLSKYGLSNAWVDKLEQFNISIENRIVLNYLTSEYIQSLQFHSKEKLWVRHIRVMKEPFCSLDYHKRRVLRESYQITGSEAKIHKYFLSFKFNFINQIGLSLSRLDSYNGLRSGIRSDLRRLKKKHSERVIRRFAVRDKQKLRHRL
jgi:hypothetical protein